MQTALNMQQARLSAAQPRATRPSRALTLRTQALFKKSPSVLEKETVRGGGSKSKSSKSTTIDKAAELEKRQSLFSSITSALDFNEVRSKSDAELLYEAKYGQRGSDGRMTREQYAALRRRVGGTAKDFWKTSIDVKGKYAEKGYVSSSGAVSSSANTTLLAIGGATVLAMVGTLALIAQ